MCEHEKKYCPHCNQLFECKVGSILLCQCTEVTLTEEERSYIRNFYDECLCATCMTEIKNEYHKVQLINAQIAQLVHAI
jgi:hypothetical protein